MLNLFAWQLSRPTAAEMTQTANNGQLAYAFVGLDAIGGAFGRTRGRINHYEYGQPVPQHRQLQLYALLRSITEKFEENLTALDERPEECEAGLVPEAVPVARVMVKACRKVLPDFEAGINVDEEAA